MSMNDILFYTSAPVFSSLLCGLLRRSGYSVTLAASGALSTESASPDLIIMDVPRELRNGVALVAHVRANHGGTPVIGLVDEGVLAHSGMAAILRDATRLVAKPFRTEWLLAVIEREFASRVAA